MLNRLFRSLTTRLVVQISCTVLIIYTIVLTYNYTQSRKEISTYAEMHCRRVAESTAHLIMSIMDESERAAKESSPVLIQNLDDMAFIKTLIKMIVSQNQELEGAILITDPVKESYKTSVIHIERTPRGLEQTDIDILKDNSTYFQLYKEVKKNRNPFWSQPMFEPETEHPVVVFAMPLESVNAGKRTFYGAFLIEVSLLSLEEITSSIKVFNTGYSFIVSRNGTFVTHPFKERIVRQTVFQFAKEFSNPSISDIGHHMIREESGFSIFYSVVLKEVCFIYYVPIPEYGWSLGVLCSRNDMFKGMTKLSRSLLLLAFAGFMILFLLVVIISTRITRPLRSLAVAANQIGKGNLNYEVPKTKERDEVGVLTNVFSEMKESLKSHIAKLTETTAARERILNELRIAHNVQMSILPSFDAIPVNSEFEIHAMMLPAREVGGDMYDFFMTDESSLWLIIGDVSGKGIPAAFYMALTKTMLHMAAITHSTPGEVLTAVNNEICRNNPYSMFVTIFIARLNLKTGVLIYSNAGHNPPIILRKNSKPLYIDEKIGPACGISPGIKYGTRRTRLSKSDTLFIFTDGVTDSLNSNGDLFSDERLYRVILESDGLNPKDLIDKVMMIINNYTEGMPQNDDISMLAMQYQGIESDLHHARSRHLNVENKLESMDKIHAFISDFGNSNGLGETSIHELQLVIEEIFINIHRYAFDDDNVHNILIMMTFDGTAVSFSIEDDGKPFDPLSHEIQEQSITIDDAKIGGHGIRIVKRLTDSLNYQYRNGKNILNARKKV